MKFARGLVVASLVSACVPLAVACGSAANSDLFSPAGGASGSAHAGSGSANAGANTAGGAEDGTSGANNGAAGNASTGDAGDGNNGASGAPAGGKNGSGESGAPGAGASGGPMTGAGAGGAPGAGAGGGPGAGAGGTPGAGAGGAPGAGAGGAPAGGASSCPASSPKDGLVCAVSTPDSCFYSGLLAAVSATTAPARSGAATERPMLVRMRSPLLARRANRTSARTARTRITTFAPASATSKKPSGCVRRSRRLARLRNQCGVWRVLRFERASTLTTLASATPATGPASAVERPVHRMSCFAGYMGSATAQYFEYFDSTRLRRCTSSCAGRMRAAGAAA